MIDLHQRYAGRLVRLDHESTECRFALCSAVNGTRRRDGRWDAEMVLRRPPAAPDWSVTAVHDESHFTRVHIYEESGGGVQELLDGGWKVRDQENAELLILDAVI